MNTIQEKISTSLKKFKKRIAIRYNDQQITYSRIEATVDRIASTLYKQDSTHGQFIGVLIENKFHFIATILAIIKCRKVFVPIDSSLPSQRIALIIRIIGLKQIVVDDDGLKKTNIDANADVSVVTVDSLLMDTDTESESIIEKYTADDLVYMFFTSGSTGLPKPVLGKNGSLCHFIDWEVSTFKVDENFRVSQLASSGFDAILRDIFVPLTAGATLCIPSERDIILDSPRFVEWITKEEISLMHCVPSVFRILKSAQISSASFPDLRYIIMAGEELKPNELRTWFDLFQDRIQLVSLYGATEVTMAKTCYFIEPSDVQKSKIPIGKAISGAQVMVLNNRLEMADYFIPGEIYIRTPYRTAGYYQDDQLNSEKFIPNTFSDDPQDLLYKTGDLGRSLPDDHIEYLGRIDDQIKIRGNRVEPAEIENLLLKHDSIKNCCVISRQDDEGEFYLCAYYAVKAEISAAELKSYLASHLPDYMVPSFLIPIEAIPLTINGKVDKDALPKPAIEITEDFVPPRDETEEKVAQIWAENLRMEYDKISIDSNFFDIGGNSVRIVSMIAKIHQAFDVRISLKEVFRGPTVRSISRFIRTLDKVPFKSIPKAEKREHYKLTAAQQRIYFISQLSAETTAYNMPRWIPLGKDIDATLVEDVLETLIDRHESLRTSFAMVDGEPVQRIHEDVEFSLEVQEWNGDKETSFVKEFVRPFDLSQGPLLRAMLLQSPEGATLLLDTHHIINDGTSETILKKEFYGLLQGNDLAPVRFQYKDYSSWQQSSVRQAEIEQQGAYWQKELSGQLPILQLPIDYLRPQTLLYQEGQAWVRLTQQESDALKKLARSKDSTLYTVLLSAFYILLSRISGQRDIIVGVPVEGREHSDAAHVIGMFVNFLPVRVCQESSQDVSGFIEEVKQKLMQAQVNSAYPFDLLVEKVVRHREMYRNPLFDAVFNFLNQFESAQGQQEDAPLVFRGAKVDLLLNGMEVKNELHFSLNYNTSLFTSATVEQFARHFYSVLAALPHSIDTSVGAIVLERQPSALKISLPSLSLQHNTVQQKLKASFNQHLDKEALQYGEVRLTYRELQKRSMRITGLLQQMNISPGSHIGVRTEDKVNLISVMLGVLHAGSVFVPIDTKLPEGRVKELLHQSKVNLLIKDSSWHTDIDVETFTIEADFFAQNTPVYPVIAPDYLPTDGIYMYFTSGTTGIPKGILGRNESLCHFIECESSTFSLSSSVRVSQLSSIGFDASLRDIFVPLSLGGTLCIPPSRDILFDSEGLVEWLDSSGIELMHCVPSVFRIVCDGLKAGQLKDLRYLVMAGEELKPNELKKWYRLMGDQVQLVNLYGATEVTMAKTLYKINASDIHRDKLSVGEAIEGSEVLVLNDSFEECERLVPGEIYIRTRYRTHGYYNDAALNASKFIRNPYSEDANDLLYKTGDAGRKRADGQLEFLGRLDSQVKIRGNRVEPGEVENYLLGHGQVDRCVVISRQDMEGQHELCAYYVSEVGLSEDVLQEYARVGLPDYMVPSNFVMLEKLPLTVNGKVDVSALPEPIRSKGAGEVERPSDLIEERVAAIWSDVLRIDKDAVSITDRFFEVGGNSLRLMSMTSRIRQAFEVRIPLEEVFKSPTIKGISRYIRNQERSHYQAIKPTEKKQYYRLSSAQRRIYFIQELDIETTAYNMPRWIQLKKEVTPERVESVLRKLIDRHESLRTSFEMVDGEPVQRIHEHVEFSLPAIDLDMDSVDEAGRNFVRPFELSTAPLLHACYAKREHDVIFFIDIHHIVSDGISEFILERDFYAILNEQAVPEVKLHYKDFSEWQNKVMHSRFFERQAHYWNQVFQSPITPLNLPYDFKRPALQSLRGNATYFTWTEAEYDRIREIALQEEVTPYMVMFAVYVILLSKLADQPNVAVGIPVAGRQHNHLENTMGIFINTVAVNTRLQEKQTFSQFVKKIKHTLLYTFENQDYPFELITDKLQVNFDRSRNPLFDVMFDYHNESLDAVAASAQDETKNVIKTGNTKFDLNLHIIESPSGMYGSLDYCTDLFERETADLIRDTYLALVNEVLNNTAIQIHELNILNLYAEADNGPDMIEFNF